MTEATPAPARFPARGLLGTGTEHCSSCRYAAGRRFLQRHQAICGTQPTADGYLR